MPRHDYKDCNLMLDNDEMVVFSCAPARDHPFERGRFLIKYDGLLLTLRT